MDVTFLEEEAPSENEAKARAAEAAAKKKALGEAAAQALAIATGAAPSPSPAPDQMVEQSILARSEVRKRLAEEDPDMLFLVETCHSCAYARTNSGSSQIPGRVVCVHSPHELYKDYDATCGQWRARPEGVKL